MRKLKRILLLILGKDKPATAKPTYPIVPCDFAIRETRSGWVVINNDEGPDISVLPLTETQSGPLGNLGA